MTTILLGIAMAILDTSMINVALPHIALQIESPASDSIFILNIYQASMVASLLPFSALGDRIGYRVVYIFGTIVFSLASLACAMAASFDSLIFARFFQGIGGSALAGVNIAIIRSIYPPNLFGRGVGIIALIVSASFCMGPLIASLLLSFGSWKSIFILNFTLGTAVFFLSMAFIPDESIRNNRKVAWFDLLIVTTALFLLTLPLAMLGMTNYGWSRLIASGVALSMGLGFVFLFPSAILKLLPTPANMKTFITTILIALFGYISQGMVLISLPFFFFATNTSAPAIAVQSMVYWSLLSGIFAYLSGRFSDRKDPKNLLMAGLLLMFLGVILLASFGTTTCLGPLFSAIAGAGFGMFQTPNLKLLLSHSSVQESGRSNGVLATIRLLGQMIGGVLAAVFLGLDYRCGARWALIAGALSALIAFGLAALQKLRVTHECR